MNSVLVDFEKTALKWNYQAIAMRMGYLFSERLFVGGSIIDTYSHFAYKERYPEHVRWQALMQNKWEPDMAKLLPEMLANIRRGRSVKNKTPQLIVAQRKVEADVNKLFFGMMNHYEEGFHKVGFMKLDDEILATKGFAFFEVDYDNPEHGKKKPFSEIFLLEKKEGDEEYMHLLPHDFVAHETIKAKWTDAHHDTAADVNSIYLQRCISVPDPRSLSTNEIMLLRRNIYNASQPFREALEEWWKLFHADDVSTADTLRFFTEKVLPHSIAIQQAADNNDILQMLVRQNPATNYVDMLIGEVPVSVLWQWYKDMGILPSQTWEVLQQRMETEDRLKRRFPVIAISSPWLDPAEASDMFSQVIPVKKSIAVD